MRLNRFHYEGFAFQEKIELKKESPIFHQIKNVLRMKNGQQLAFFDKNQEGVYDLDIISDKKIALSLHKELESELLNKKNITLFQAIIKGDKMDWLVQKATELGVNKIVPVLLSRTEKKNINLQRLKKISLEASEQCGRRDLVEITSPLKFKEALDSLVGLSFLGDFSGKDFMDIFLEIKENDKNINVFIGPEGGFTPEEISLAKKKKITVVKLNNYVLRSETATLAFLSLISNL